MGDSVGLADGVGVDVSSDVALGAGLAASDDFFRLFLFVFGVAVGDGCGVAVATTAGKVRLAIGDGLA
ncbi:MAG: hypothetical protein ACXV8H_11595 [Chthoniobacterales bacterium]